MLHINMEQTFKEKLNKLPNEAKKALKELFSAPVITPVQNAEPPVIPAVEAPATIKTKDGTEIKYDTPTPVEGVTMVTVITPDGELPAPDGEIELEDGTKLTIAEGKISKIQPAEVVAPVDNAAEMAAMNEKYTGLEGQLANANKIIAALTSRFEAQEKEQKILKDTITKFSSDWNEMLGTATAEPIVNTHNQPISKSDRMFNKLNFKK